MQPTPPTSHWGRWTTPPDMSYSFKHRFHFPGGVEAAAAAGEAAGAAAGASAARMAGTGAGGMPPQVAAYHWHGHGYGPYGRGFRPRFGFFRRFIWFGLGVGVASWWIHHQERKHERERWLNATGGVVPPSGSQADGWGWRHHHHHNNFYRPLPTEPSSAPASGPPVDHIPSSTPVAAAIAAPSAAPAPESPVVSETRKHWGRWRDRRPTVEEERLRMAQSNTPLPASSAPSAAGPAAPIKGMSEEEKDVTVFDKDEEYRRLKEVVERLWAAKRSGVEEAQKEANERAKDYAREKLDKLSLALDSLRESLRKDGGSNGEKKLV